MRSVIVKKSYGSVKVFWLNRKVLLERLKSIAHKIIADDRNVESVVLFGSLAENRATPFSDIDILIIVSYSHKRFIDRPLDFIDYFKDLELNVDLFVYTKEELDKSPLFKNSVLSKGKYLARRF